MSTAKGLRLAEKLLPAIGMTQEIIKICSGICRVAAKIQRLAVERCNGDCLTKPGGEPRRFPDWKSWNQWLATEENSSEERMDMLVSSLPTVDGESITWSFEDVRGAVRLNVPSLPSDSFGGEGIVVP